MRRNRRSVVGAIAFVMTLIALSTSGAAAPASGASQVTAQFELKGGGTWGVYRELLPWQNALSESKSPIDLQYTPHGTLLGRNDFVDGDLDYVISGAPFTADDLAKVKGGANGLISAPVQISSLAFLVQQPVPEGLVSLKLKCDPDDPNVPDPTKCIVKDPLEGPIRVPNENLAAMVLRYAGPDAVPVNSWNSPNVLKAMDVPNFTTPTLAGPAPVVRSDADELNLFLQQYAAIAAPTTWAALKALETRLVWDPNSERLARLPGTSRDGVTQQGAQLALGGGDPSTGTISNFTAGVIAPTPASALGELHESFPKAKVQYIEVQNANGDWVSPSSASINAGIAAGNGAPLYALTNKVPGAYPLSWTDNLYAPAHGLAIDKAEAIATVIRYIATAGQGAADAVGEGRLSPALTTLALAQANQLVRSNCEGNEHVVENTDPGPFAPDVPAMKTIGTVVHCEPGPATGNGADGSGSGGDGGSSGDFASTSSFSGSGSGSAADAGAGTDSTTAIAKHGADAVLSASKLPLGMPPVSGGVDRLATLLLGVGAYFLLRKPVRRLLKRDAT